MDPELGSVFVFPVVDPRGTQLLGTVERSDLASFCAQYSEEEKQRLAARDVRIDYERPVVTVLENTPLSQLHMFFITAQLRYVFVTRQGVPVGLVTREVLAAALRHQRHLI